MKRRLIDGKVSTITNASKQMQLAEKASIARTLWQRMKGLLGRPSLAQGEALLIPGCSSIHTIFMRFPIDALFVDKQLRVVKTVERLRPFHLAAAPPAAWGVVELASGTISRSRTTVGDRLEWSHGAERRP